MVTAKGHLSGQIPTGFPTRFPWKIANKSPFLSPFSGWWLTYHSEKYDFVSWDDDIPNIWKNVQAMFQTTKQYGNCYRENWLINQKIQGYPWGIIDVGK
jgi:hypothetical protein